MVRLSIFSVVVLTNWIESNFEMTETILYWTVEIFAWERMHFVELYDLLWDKLWSSPINTQITYATKFSTWFKTYAVGTNIQDQTSENSLWANFSEEK